MESSRKAYTVATVVVDSYDLGTGEVLSATVLARSAMTDPKQGVEDLEVALNALPGSWCTLTPSEIRDLHRRWEDRRIVLWTQLELF